MPKGEEQVEQPSPSTEEGAFRNIVALETSCDETCVAVLQGDRITANVVASQMGAHVPYGGVVPELATRAHLQKLEPVLREALGEAELDPDRIDAVAATRGPGLPPALMIGWRAAQGLALALDVPLIPVHHHEAHLYSPWVRGSPPQLDRKTFRPSVSLVVSGGHTLLVQVEAPLKHRILGGTLDDAAGECFDKTARLLGLPYPGGAEMDRLAKEGRAERFRFPRPLLRDPNDNFSFSGLKTAVRYFVEDRPDVRKDPRSLRDVCAGVQAAIVEVLVTKLIRAARRCDTDTVTVSGGVACNSGLRRTLEQVCPGKGLRVRIAPPPLCTDNAAMVALVSRLHLDAGRAPSADDRDILPSWRIPDCPTADQPES